MDILGTSLAIGSKLLGNVVNGVFQTTVNNKNLKFQREQFDYQKFLNENQYQISSKDALKAGINPLAMTGGSLSSGSYTSNAQASGIDLDMSDFIGTMLTNKTSENNVNTETTTQKNINDDNLDFQREENNKNRQQNLLIKEKELKNELEISNNEIKSRERIERDKLAENKNQFDADISFRIADLNNQQRDLFRNFCLSKDNFNQWYFTTYGVMPDDNKLWQTMINSVRQFIDGLDLKNDTLRRYREWCWENFKSYDTVKYKRNK